MTMKKDIFHCKNTKDFLEKQIKLLDGKKINEIELKDFINKASQIFLDLNKVYLFGSRFNGNPREDSDYDLIFEFSDNSKYTINEDGFEYLDTEKIYTPLRKNGLEYLNKNKKYLFHIFLEEPQFSMGNILIWERKNILSLNQMRKSWRILKNE